ncbi:hypothetical protein MMC29_006423 [Sticta canariensis]|nr:hypothetical protein [Sticta canariensis]
MAEAVTILTIVNISATLSLKCAKIIQNNHERVAKYKQAELDILQLAWNQIEEWSWAKIFYQTDENLAEADLLRRLDRSPGFGKMIMSVLEEDLTPFMNTTHPHSFGRRTKLIWNNRTFQAHRDRIRGQVMGINLSISVTNLPSTLDQNDLLDRRPYIIRKSDDSACSIMPFQASTHDSVGLDRFENTDMIYQELSVDNEFFTASVYKINYRNPLTHQFFNNAGIMMELNRSSVPFESDNQSQFTE